MIITFIKEAYTLAKKNREEFLVRKEKAKIASVFNKRYTYDNVYDSSKPRLTEGSAMYGIMPAGGYAWMCPECNKIHHPNACSVMVGLIYPKCCSRSEGDRMEVKRK